MADTDVYNRWTHQIARLRKQISRPRTRAEGAGRSSVPDEVLCASEECLTTCDSLLREWAGAHHECAAVSTRLQDQEDLWDYLFDQMPIACIELDAVGTIVRANTPAALLLNTSVKFLKNRMLLHYAQDREQVAAVIRRSTLDATRQSATVAIRPRERALILVDATMIPRTPGDTTSWLWFFTPQQVTDSRSLRTAVRPLQSAVGA